MPNVVDYEATRAAFSWADARRGLNGIPGGGLNIVHEAVIIVGDGGDDEARHIAGGVGFDELLASASAAFEIRRPTRRT